MLRHTALALLLLATACADPEPVPAAHRIRLFDRMESAILETPPRPVAPPTAETVLRADFEGADGVRTWLMVGDEQPILGEGDERLHIEPDLGANGAGLAIGPLGAGETGRPC